MADLNELLQGLSPHPLRGRVGRDEFRELLFKIEELLLQGVLRFGRDLLLVQHQHRCCGQHRFQVAGPFLRKVGAGIEGDPDA